MLIRLRICSLASSPQPCFLTTSSICCGCVMRGEHGLDTYVACRTMQCSHGRQERQLELSALPYDASSCSLDTLQQHGTALFMGQHLCILSQGLLQRQHPTDTTCQLSSVKGHRCTVGNKAFHPHRAKCLHDRAGMMDAMQSCLGSSACMTCTPHL